MNKIINILKAHKSIPLDKFINISLYDKDFGYYIKKNPFGKQGDFVTSPLVSNLFGEMIAIWCVSFWEHLKKPKKILLVELGPGDGSLCIDLIRTFKNFKNFYDSVEINLLEKNYNLMSRESDYFKNLEIALERIDDGSFGKCNICEDLIAEERMIEVPNATKCVKCKEKDKLGLI